MMQQGLKSTTTIKKRAKSVYSQRNLGTIKERKKEKREEKEVNNGETIMQILRMRYVTVSSKHIHLILPQAGYIGFHCPAAQDHAAITG